MSRLSPIDFNEETPPPSKLPAWSAPLEKYEDIERATREHLERIARLALSISDAQICVLVPQDQQQTIVTHSAELDESIRTKWEHSFARSFCRALHDGQLPLTFDQTSPDNDAATHVFLQEAGVCAWIAARLISPDGISMGSLCVLDTRAREWTEKERSIFDELAAMASAEFTAQEDKRHRQSAESHLRLQLAVTQILSSATDVPSALRSVLELITCEFGFSVGELWREDTKGKLRCAGIWHTPGIKIPSFVTVTQSRAFARGEGLPGHVWEGGQAHWTPDLATSKHFSRNTEAAENGLKSAFGLPLRSEQTGGVLVFYGRETRAMNPEHEAILDAIGRQVGVFIERHWIEETSERRRKLLDAILEELDEGIVACDADGELTLLNRATRELHGMDEAVRFDQWTGRYDLFQSDGITPMRRQDLPLVRVLAGEQVRGVEMVIAPKNGIRRSIVADAQLLHDPSGQLLGAVVVLHDITHQRQAEATIHEIETLLRTFMNNTPAVTFIKDEDGRIVYTNATLQKAFGIGAEQWIGKRDHELWPDSVAEEMRKTDLEVLEKGVSKQTITAISTPAGPVDWLIHKFRIEDKAGRKLLGAIALDITGQKRAEERLQKIADNVTASIAYIDAQGRYQFVNQAYKRWLDLDPSAMLGKTVSEALGEETYERLHPAILKALSGEQVHYEGEFYGGPTPRYIDVTYVPDMRADGSVRGFYVTGSDLTERREAEIALARSEELFRQLSQMAPVGIYRTDAAGKVTFVNSYFCNQAGLMLETALGDGWANAVHPDDRDMAFVEWQRATEAGRDFEVEYRFLLPSGRITWVSDRAIPMRDEDGAIIGYLGTTHDVTEEKAAAEAMQKARELAELASQAKSLFLANMSHEVRTPLHGILGVSGILLESPLSAEQRQFTNTIHSSAESLLTIVNDILDFSKIEAGRIELDHREFALSEMLREVAQLNAIRASAKGLLIQTSVEAEVPELLVGDLGRLRQVLNNLVGNAIKFSERGSIRIVVACEPTAERTSLRFEVRDSGIGISPEAQKRIFDPFSQADVSTTRKYGGTGLGLAICKQLVHLMGGDLALESELGVGSTFRFTAVFDAVEKSLPKPEHREPQLGSDSLANLRVLLAEDSDVNRMMAVHHLKKFGCAVTAVTDGQAAVEAVERESFDIVLMDCQMPIMDGYTATSEIRRRELAPGLRIVAVTANAMNGEREKCLAAGMDDYLSKPFKPARLREVLQCAVRSDAYSLQAAT